MERLKEGGGEATEEKRDLKRTHEGQDSPSKKLVDGGCLR